MAFVVPAEIGHAPYAVPLLRYLLANFDRIQIIGVREKLFPDLSEDCWLLFCSGFGGDSSSILFSEMSRFKPTSRPPAVVRHISRSEWEQWDARLRPFLLPSSVLDRYRQLADSNATFRLSEVARVGIGYVTGANDFFHLRPSVAQKFGISETFLRPAVRNGRDLIGHCITNSTVQKWVSNDEPHFLLRLKRSDCLPSGIRTYLESGPGREARQAYKCRTRSPWYAVPDVHCARRLPFIYEWRNAVPRCKSGAVRCH